MEFVLGTIDYVDRFLVDIVDGSELFVSETL